MTELGTDIYLRGKNQGDVGLCDYYGLDATNGNVAWLWNHCYKALFNINLFFETIDQTPFADEDEKSQFKAEMYVMRALFLWIVTETWGDSYLPMTTDETEGTEARRSPRAKFYEEIIGALEAAIGLFPDTRTTESGRIDMPAAKALLARMYLYNEQWDEAADMASQVIGHYGLELCPSLKDLWADDKTNNEFIWTTEFTEDDAFRQANGYWSWYAMYIDRFPGVQTMLKWTGYGGCQAIPSTYFMDLFDRDADKRWSDLHQWVWYYNDPADDRSEFPDNQWREYIDTALYLCPDVLPLAEHKRMEKTFTVFDRNDMFDADGIPQDRWTFIGMTKFYDHTRPWITHCSLQRQDLYRHVEYTTDYRTRYQKPIVWDEIAYEGNIDMGSTMGSYFGLLFLIAAYSAIGIFTSTLSDNQIVAFIVAVFLCFFFYFGFEGIASVVPNIATLVAAFGMQDHFKSMSRGVLDTRDIFYFTSITVVFLSFTVYNLKSFKS